MLNRNFASVSAQIARANAPYISPKKQDNLVEALRQGANDYYRYDAIRRNNAEQERMNVLSQNLANALESGDEKAINDAYYAYNPQGAVETLMKIKQAKEQSDLDFARQKELLGLQNKYALALQDAKNQNQGIDMTSAAKNYEYLRSIGLNDNDAMAIAFGGNTDAVGNYLVSGGLGKMGLSTYGREMGKTLAKNDAEKIAAQKSLEQLYFIKDQLFGKNKLAERAKIDTIPDRLTPTSLTDEDTRYARQAMNNYLGSLRLDQMQYLKGAISDKEQEFLADMATNNISKYSRPEIAGNIDAFIKRTEQKIKPKTRTVTDEDAWGGI